MSQRPSQLARIAMHATLLLAGIGVGTATAGLLYEGTNKTTCFVVGSLSLLMAAVAFTAYRQLVGKE